MPNSQAIGAIKSILRFANSNWTDSVEYFFKKYKNLGNCISFIANKYNIDSLKEFYNKCVIGEYEVACKIAKDCFEDIKKVDIFVYSKLQNNLSYFFADYYHIISSSNFRRLSDKTQLFVREELDFSRRRLTHSLEVASLSCLIANKLIDKYNLQNDDANWLSMSSGVLHDIGNPPFGHYGEEVIKEFFCSENIRNKLINLCKEETIIYYNDLCCFDGNAQSLRIATKLMKFYDKDGASLSCGTLGSIIKYPFSSNESESNKIGYFITEKDIVEDLKFARVYIPNVRNPFACILEMADDLAYLISDIEDSVHKGIVTFESFTLKDFLDYTPLISMESKDKIQRCLNGEIIDLDTREKNLIAFNQSLEDKFNINIEKNRKNRQKVFEKTLRPLLYQLRNDIIKEFPKKENNIFDRIFYDGVDYKTEILDDSSYIYVIEWLKAIKNNYVFPSKIVTINEINGDKIIGFLLNDFFDALYEANIEDNNLKNSERVNRYSYKNKLLSLISKDFIEVFFTEYNKYSDTINISREDYFLYLKMRLLIDYISGMTDSYARNLYLELKSLK